MSATVGILQSYAEKAKWRPTAQNMEASRKIFADSSWADGLRGLAAVFVMFSHMTLAFARYIVAPSISMNGPSHVMQRPIFRLVAQGPAWVSCFIILSGFVNSLKPVKLARAGQTETALSNLAVSSFRRSFRLFLPALAATICSWFICQFGAYETSRNSDAYWLAVTSPKRSLSWGTAIDDLVKAVFSTWMFDPNNPYDQPQWALLYLLFGSMICFTALMVTINLTPRYRVGALFICWLWGWNWDDRVRSPMVAIGIFSGILLAELHQSDIPLRLSHFSPIYTPPFTLISLFLMSFPGEYQNQSSWSNFLLKLHYKIFPAGASLDRSWPAMGSTLLCFTIIMSPHLRKLLSHRVFIWLGKISFPLYLLHGSFMRSILAWLLFATQSLTEMEERNGAETYVLMKYPLPSMLTFWIVVPIFFCILFPATHLWAVKVEPHFGAITKKAEEVLCGKREANRPSVLPVRHD